MPGERTARARGRADLTCEAFSPANHRVGTKAATGRCSWTEDCSDAPTWSCTVTTSGRASRYGLCDRHHQRIHQYYDTDWDPATEVEHLLRTWARGFAAACRANPAHEHDGDRRDDLQLGRRGLETDECSAFLRTWRAELVDVDVDGTFTLPSLGACPPELHLVGRSGRATTLHTEYLVQIGVVAELVEDLGWGRRELAFEQGEWDLLGRREGRVQLAVEAKARAAATDPDGLARLERSLLGLSEVPTRKVPDNHERKWAALREFVESGPVDVLLVASGARTWLHARLDDTGHLRIAAR